MEPKEHKTETRRQREAPLDPARTERDREVVRGFLERLWKALHSPYGDQLVAALRRLKAFPEGEQAKVVAFSKGLPAIPPSSATREQTANWIFAHAMRRGFALPGLQKRDLFVGIAELVAHDEDIAAVMDDSRNNRGDYNTESPKRLDQRKVMKRRNRLHARRRAAGY